MKKLYMIGAISLTVGLLSVPHANATRGNENNASQVNLAVSSEDRAASKAELTALRQELRAQAEDKRTEIQQRVTEKKAEIKTKLADKRLAACEKREAKINSIVDKSVAQNQRHLAVFEKIEERVKTFYADKNLNVENYEALTATVDEKHTAAVGALEAAGDVDFSCTDADATNPGSIVKQVLNDSKEAIKEYRTAIKDLTVAIKGASTGVKDGSDDSTETETETDTSTNTDATNETETETNTTTEQEAN